MILNSPKELSNWWISSTSCNKSLAALKKKKWPHQWNIMEMVLSFETESCWIGSEFNSVHWGLHMGFFLLALLVLAATLALPYHHRIVWWGRPEQCWFPVPTSSSPREEDKKRFYVEEQNRKEFSEAWHNFRIRPPPLRTVCTHIR